jgi:hypothetical protein
MFEPLYTLYVVVADMLHYNDGMMTSPRMSHYNDGMMTSPRTSHYNDGMMTSPADESRSISSELDQCHFNQPELRNFNLKHEHYDLNRNILTYNLN